MRLDDLLVICGKGSRMLGSGALGQVSTCSWKVRVCRLHELAHHLVSMRSSASEEMNTLAIYVRFKYENEIRV